MGMDMYIYRSKFSPAKFTKDDWDKFYSTEYDDDNPPPLTEVFYARKFWELHYAAVKREGEYECGDYIRLEREDLERMLDCAIHTPNYFGNFNSVPPLCEILYTFDEAEEMGWHFWYEADW